MKVLNTLVWSAVLVIVLVLGYAAINWTVFLNVVEEQLPESEERVPDLGIVKQTDLDN